LRPDEEPDGPDERRVRVSGPPLAGFVAAGGGRPAGAGGAAAAEPAAAVAAALTRLADIRIPRTIPRTDRRIRPVSHCISRRAFARASVLALGSFAILRHARGEAPMELRCSLDTAPSHPRNVAFRDYLGKLEQASGGQIKIRLFESGS